MKYVDVILPLAIAHTYTFGIPLEFQDIIAVGKRVEVQFGKRKIYSGIAMRIHNDKPEVYEVKPIRSILDETPIVTEEQISFWKWIASYYMCSLGEVMNAALPSFMKLESETYITLNDDADIYEEELSNEEFMLIEALQIKKEMKKSLKKSNES